VQRAARLARRLDRLVDDLAAAPRPGSVQTWLAGTLDDPGLTVRYRRPGTGALVDASGGPAPPRTPPGATSVAVVRGNEELAVVLHGRGTAGTALLRQRLGAAARLVIDNERLRAELLAQLAELRRSRARLVESADSERRALERDLHDGAQQRLLAALHRLDRARAAGDAASVLPPLVEEADALVADVREFAHGLFPAVLEQAGLEAALETLGDTAPVPLIVEFDGPEAALPRAVARAAYAMVATTVQARCQGDVVRVRAQHRDGVLVVEVSGAEFPRPVDPETGGASWIDRVEAVGGSVDVTADGWRVELPCELP
jgi:signal transduction histidine kinase